MVVHNFLKIFILDVCIEVKAVMCSLCFERLSVRKDDGGLYGQQIRVSVIFCVCSFPH